MAKAQEKKEPNIESRGDRSLVPVDFVQAEKNLISIGFFSSTRKNRKKGEIKKVEIKTLRDQKTVEIEITIAPNALHEVPTTADQDKYMAFLKIVDNIRKKTGKIENPISFTSYELLKILGINESAGKNYKEIENWLHKMQSTSILSKGAVYFAGRKKYSQEAVSVFSRVKTMGEELENGKAADRNYVWFSEWQLENLNFYHLLPIDYDTYSSLKNSISKILVPFLQMWLFATSNKGVFEKNYEDICNLVGIKTYKYLSKIKEKLTPSLNELVSCGTLRKWEVKKRVDNSGFKIVFWHGDKFLRNQLARKKRTPKNTQNHITLSKAAELVNKVEYRELIQILTEEFQITLNKATELVNNHPAETEKQAAAFKHRNIKIESKSGFLIKAIEDRFALPEEYLKSIEDRKLKQREKKRQATIDNCGICNEVGERYIKSDMDKFFGLGRECTHHPEIECEFENHII